MKSLRWIYCTFIHSNFKSLWLHTQEKEIFLINYELETLANQMNLIQKARKVRMEFPWFCFCLPFPVRFQTCCFSFSFHSNKNSLCHSHTDESYKDETRVCGYNSNKNLNKEVCSLSMGIFSSICVIYVSKPCWQIVYLGFSLHIWVQVLICLAGAHI